MKVFRRFTAERIAWGAAGTRVRFVFTCSAVIMLTLSQLACSVLVFRAGVYLGTHSTDPVTVVDARIALVLVVCAFAALWIPIIGSSFVMVLCLAVLRRMFLKDSVKHHQEETERTSERP
jgi:hypothetical protein